MGHAVIIREYTPDDKSRVMNLIRLNTPEYFAPEEEADLSEYLDRWRELYYVLETGGEIVGCGGINFADHHTTGKISWDIIHPPGRENPGHSSASIQARKTQIHRRHPENYSPDFAGGLPFLSEAGFRIE